MLVLCTPPCARTHIHPSPLPPPHVCLPPRTHARMPAHRISGRQYVEMIEAVSQEDVRAFVRNLLATKPSLAVYGDGTQVGAVWGWGWGLFGGIRYLCIMYRYLHHVHVSR